MRLRLRWNKSKRAQKSQTIVDDSKVEALAEIDQVPTSRASLPLVPPKNSGVQNVLPPTVVDESKIDVNQASTSKKTQSKLEKIDIAKTLEPITDAQIDEKYRAKASTVTNDKKPAAENLPSATKLNISSVKKKKVSKPARIKSSQSKKTATSVKKKKVSMKLDDVHGKKSAAFPESAAINTDLPMDEPKYIPLSQRLKNCDQKSASSLQTSVPRDDLTSPRSIRTAKIDNRSKIFIVTDELNEKATSTKKVWEEEDLFDIDTVQEGRVDIYTVQEDHVGIDSVHEDHVDIDPAQEDHQSHKKIAPFDLLPELGSIFAPIQNCTQCNEDVTVLVSRSQKYRDNFVDFLAGNDSMDDTLIEEEGLADTLDNRTVDQDALGDSMSDNDDASMYLASSTFNTKDSYSIESRSIDFSNTKDSCAIEPRSTHFSNTKSSHAIESRSNCFIDTTESSGMSTYISQSSTDVSDSHVSRATDTTSYIEEPMPVVEEEEESPRQADKGNSVLFAYFKKNLGRQRDSTPSLDEEEFSDDISEEEERVQILPEDNPQALCAEACKDKKKLKQHDKRSRASPKLIEKKAPLSKIVSTPESGSDIVLNVCPQKKKTRIRSISPKLPLKKPIKSTFTVSPKLKSTSSISPNLEDQENSSSQALCVVSSSEKKSKTSENAPRAFPPPIPHSSSSSKKKASGKRPLISSRSQSPFSNISNPVRSASPLITKLVKSSRPTTPTVRTFFPLVGSRSRSPSPFSNISNPVRPASPLITKLVKSSRSTTPTVRTFIPPDENTANKSIALSHPADETAILKMKDIETNIRRSRSDDSMSDLTGMLGGNNSKPAAVLQTLETKLSVDSVDTAHLMDELQALLGDVNME